MTLGLVIILGGLAAGFLVVGWRGRRVDNHPHCRGCGYNLFGVYPASASCPECGRSLREAGAVMDGGRKRRRGMLAVGGVFAVLAVGCVVLMASSMSIYRLTPDVLLAWMLNDASAREEAKGRLEDGSYDPTAAGWVIAQALEVQGDRTVPWHPSWGELIESAWIGGYAAPSDLKQYAQQAVGFEIRIRDKIKRGLDPVMHIDFAGEIRLGFSTTVEIKLTQHTLSFDGVAITLQPTLKSDFEVSGTGWNNSVSHLPTAGLSSELGTKKISLEVTPAYTLTIPQAGLSAQPHRGPRQTLTASIEVVDHFTGQYLTTGPSDAERAANAGVWFDTDNKAPRSLTVGMRHFESIHGFQLWVRSGGVIYPVEVESQSSRSGPSQGGSRGNYSHSTVRFDLHALPPKVFQQTHIDLMVRPDWEEAEAAVHSQPLWLGQWTFRNIPLDAEPVPKWEPLTRTAPPSLVPAEVVTLTPEAAQHDPTP